MIHFVVLAGSHFFRPWEDPIPQPAPPLPQPAPDVGQHVPADGQQANDAHQQASNAYELAPDVGQQDPIAHQPAHDANQHAPNALHQALDAHQPAPEAQQDVPDAHQQVPDTQQHAHDAHQPSPEAFQHTLDTRQHAPYSHQHTPDNHQGVRNAHQHAFMPPLNSPYLPPYVPYPVHPAGIPGEHQLRGYTPLYQVTPDTTLGVPTYHPWMSVYPPPPPQIPMNFQQPPTAQNFGFPAQRNQRFPAHRTDSIPRPAAPVSAKMRHDLLLEKISKICRQTDSAYVVSISDTYMKQVQWIEKKYASALKKCPGDPSVQAHFDEQRLELIRQKHTELQAFQDSEKTKCSNQGPQKNANDQPGTSANNTENVNETATRESNNDCERPSTSNNTAQRGVNSTDDDTDSDDKDGETENQPPNDESASSHGSRFALKTTQVLETWYVKHINRPYAGSDVKKLAKKAGITEKQVKKWLSNRRTRDKNTRARKQDTTAQPSYYMGGSRYHPYQS